LLQNLRSFFAESNRFNPVKGRGPHGALRRSIRAIPESFRGSIQRETAMKVTYDPSVDIVRIFFRDAPIEESDEEKPGMILDYDSEGNVVGMEILDASKRVENPGAVEYALAT
jgi:uncharacterized protein YuzE